MGINTSSISDSQMGSLLGNWYTCTVIGRIVASAVSAAEGGEGTVPDLAPPISRNVVCREFAPRRASLLALPQDCRKSNAPRRVR
eukprot:2891095-Karenia_brevis.AAC.1